MGLADPELLLLATGQQALACLPANAAAPTASTSSAVRSRVARRGSGKPNRPPSMRNREMRPRGTALGVDASSSRRRGTIVYGDGSRDAAGRPITSRLPRPEAPTARGAASISVVLPDPFGPSTARNSPGAMSRVEALPERAVPEPQGRVLEGDGRGHRRTAAATAPSSPWNMLAKEAPEGSVSPKPTTGRPEASAAATT